MRTEAICSNSLADDRELIMAILKYGPDVEVLGPSSLRARVRGQLAQAMSRSA